MRKMWKKVVALALSAVMLVSALPLSVFAQSDKTKSVSLNGESPDNVVASETVSWNGGAPNKDWYSDSKSTFEITTAEQLAGLAVLVNEENKTFAGKMVKLLVNVDWSSKSWTPIGNEAHPFKGIFDGNHNTIRKS